MGVKKQSRTFFIVIFFFVFVLLLWFLNVCFFISILISVVYHFSFPFITFLFIYFIWSVWHIIVIFYVILWWIFWRYWIACDSTLLCAYWTIYIHINIECLLFSLFFWRWIFVKLTTTTLIFTLWGHFIIKNVHFHNICV